MYGIDAIVNAVKFIYGVECMNIYYIFSKNTFIYEVVPLKYEYKIFNYIWQKVDKDTQYIMTVYSDFNEKLEDKLYEFLGINNDDGGVEYKISVLYPNTYRTLLSVDKYKKKLQKRIDRNISLGEMFFECEQLTNVPLFNTQNIEMMERMFGKCYVLNNIPLFNTQNVKTMYQMFVDCKSLTSVPIFNTQNVTNMKCMFDWCTSLTSVPQFNTQNVTNMEWMFNNCSSLTSIPTFDIRNVKNITNMLYHTKITEVTFKNKLQDLQITSEILCGIPNKIKINLIYD